MHSFQNFIVRLIPNHPPPLETRIWKLVVRALGQLFKSRLAGLTQNSEQIFQELFYKFENIFFINLA